MDRPRLALLVATTFVVGLLAGGMIGIFLAAIVPPKSGAIPAIYDTEPTPPQGRDGRVALSQA
jgi:hypothetical protein